MAFDEDYNARFPFLGPDGAALLFPEPEVAGTLRTRMADGGDGHFSLKKLGADQLDPFLTNLRATGIPAVRVFLRSGVCLLPFRDLDPLPAGHLVDQVNRGLRGLGIRTLQLNARLNKLNASLRGTEKQKQLTASTLTARANALRELGNTILYVLGPAPYTPGITFYTADALKRAHVLQEAAKLPEESLIAPGDRSLGVYEGKLALRAMSLPGQTGLKQSFVLAFTQRNVCEGARKHYAQSGAGDSVVAVTWDELKAQAESCAGVMLDQGALGMMIPGQWFADVERFRQSPNPILVNLKEKDPPAGDKA